MLDSKTERELRAKFKTKLTEMNYKLRKDFEKEIVKDNLEPGDTFSLKVTLDFEIKC